VKPTDTTKYAAVLRPLLAEEREALKASLKKDGLLSDLILDQHGVLLEGYNRLRLCEELGIEPRFRQVHTTDPVNWIKGLQKARRNLNREEMRQLIAEQVKEIPRASNRAVAKIVGASDHTVESVRSQLVANGEIAADVIRFRSDGKVVHQSVTKAEDENTAMPLVNEENQSCAQVAHKEQNAKTKPEKPSVAPVTVSSKGRYLGITENILAHCADDNEFYSLAMMVKKLDPDGTLKLDKEQLRPSVNRLITHKDVRVETRPAAHNQFRYRFYREVEKTINLSTLRTKFGPIIEDLKSQAKLPISHQTSGRFLAAAGALIQLLRDLETE
jgi:hypothetical protein